MAEYGNNYDYGQSPYYKDDGDNPVVIVGASPMLEDLPLQGDIKLFPFEGVADLSDVRMADRDLYRDPGIETAIIISIFTNRRAESEDSIPDNSADKYGYWGDVLEAPGDSMGSKLWLVSRNKNVPEVLPLVEEYAKEALQWMVEDGVAETIKVSAERYDMETILMSVEILRPGEADSIFYKYYFNWRAQVLKEV